MQDVTFFSPALQRQMPYRVVLPANYSTRDESSLCFTFCTVVVAASETGRITLTWRNMPPTDSFW